MVKTKLAAAGVIAVAVPGLIGVAALGVIAVVALLLAASGTAFDLLDHFFLLLQRER